MENGKISGYVCQAIGDRLGLRWAGAVVTVFFLGFTALLIWQAVLDGHPGFWLCILLLMVFLTVIEIAGYRNLYANEIQFTIGPDAVRNIYPRGQVSLELSRIRYITLLTCEFSRRAPWQRLSFYLLSPRPIGDEDIEYEGVSWFQRLQKTDIVILPISKETDAWVTATLALPQVPAYPKQHDRKA